MQGKIGCTYAGPSAPARTARIAAAGLALAIGAVCSAEPRFDVLFPDPNLLDGTLITIWDVSDNGIVTGTVRRADDRNWAYRWNVATGEVQHLWPGPGWRRIDPRGVNTSGQVVGAVWEEGSSIRHSAFVWDSDGFNPFGLGFQGTWSAARGINNDGLVAGGFVEPGRSRFRAFSFETATGDLTNPRTVEGGIQVLSVAAVSDAGHITGTAHVGGEGTAVPHPFVYHPERGFTVLPSLNAMADPSGRALGVNSDGVVVGQMAVPQTYLPSSSSNPRYQRRAVRWENGEVTDLGSLGGPFNSAGSIDDQGRIAGVSMLPDQQLRAFLYEDGQIADLNSLIDPDLGLVLTDAAVHNNGWISASGVQDGQFRAVLLIPIE